MRARALRAGPKGPQPQGAFESSLDSNPKGPCGPKGAPFPVLQALPPVMFHPRRTASPFALTCLIRESQKNCQLLLDLLQEVFDNSVEKTELKLSA